MKCTIWNCTAAVEVEKPIRKTNGLFLKVVKWKCTAASPDMPNFLGENLEWHTHSSTNLIYVLEKLQESQRKWTQCMGYQKGCTDV